MIAEDGSLIGILSGGPFVAGNEFASYPAYFSYVVPYDYVKKAIGSILPKEKSVQIIYPNVEN